MPGELRESFKTTPTSSFSSPSPNESEIVNDKDKTEQQTRHASKSKSTTCLILQKPVVPANQRARKLSLKEIRQNRAMSDPLHEQDGESPFSSNSDQKAQKHMLRAVRDQGYGGSQSNSFASDGAGIIWFSDWPMYEVEDKYSTSWVRFFIFYIKVFAFALLLITIWHSIPLEVNGKCQNVYIYTLAYVGLYYWISVLVILSWMKFTAGIEDAHSLIYLSISGYVVNSILVFLLEKYIAPQWFRWLISCALIISLLPIVFSNLLWQMRRSQIQSHRIRIAFRGFMYIVKRLFLIQASISRVPHNITMFWASIWMVTAVWITFLASVGMAVLFDELTTEFEQSLFPVFYLTALTCCGILLVRVGSVVDEVLNRGKNMSIPTQLRNRGKNTENKRTRQKALVTDDTMLFNLETPDSEIIEFENNVLEDLNFRQDPNIYGIEETHTFLKLIGLNWKPYEVNKLFNMLSENVTSTTEEMQKIWSQKEILEAYKKFETFGGQPSVRVFDSFVRNEITIDQLWSFYDFRDIGSLSGASLNFFLYCLLIWIRSFEGKEGDIPLPRYSNEMLEMWKAKLDSKVPSLFDNGVIYKRNFNHIHAYIENFLQESGSVVGESDMLGSNVHIQVFNEDGAETAKVLPNLMSGVSERDTKVILEKYDDFQEAINTKHVESSLTQVRQDHKKLCQEFSRAKVERVLSNAASFGSFKSKILSDSTSIALFDSNFDDVGVLPMFETETLGSKTGTFFWFLLYRATYFQLFLKIHSFLTVIVWVLLDLFRYYALYVIPLTSFYAKIMRHIKENWGLLGKFLHVILRSPQNLGASIQALEDGWSEEGIRKEYSYRIFQTYLLDASITFLCLFEFIVSTSVLYHWDINRAYMNGMTDMNRDDYEKLMLIVLLLVLLEIGTVLLIMLSIQIFFEDVINISHALRRLFGSQVFQWIFFTALVHCLQDPWLFRNTVEFCGHLF